MSRIPDVVLVVGGTGMLAAAVRTLLGAGRTVVLVARRASQFEHKCGDLVAVDADWSDPPALAAAVGTATAGREIGAALLWVHRPHRDAVAVAVDHVLPPHAVIVRLWGTGSGQPQDDASRAPRLDGRTVREVYLGSGRDSHGWRWLTHDEISAGALHALASDAREQTIGELERR